MLEEYGMCDRENKMTRRRMIMKKDMATRVDRYVKRWFGYKERIVETFLKKRVKLMEVASSSNLEALRKSVADFRLSHRFCRNYAVFLVYTIESCPLQSSMMYLIVLDVLHSGQTSAIVPSSHLR